MSVPSQIDFKKAELDAVLASELFAKSPNLAKMLQYIGVKHFEGQEHVLKEYNIGVDALGRPPEFDPKSDSIVRVEAHRLREKLKRYYETEGAGHEVVITLQVGRYVPQFLRRNEIAGKTGDPSVRELLSETQNLTEKGDLLQVQTQPTVSRSTYAHLATNSDAAQGVRTPDWRGYPGKMVGLFAILALLVGVGVVAIMRPMAEKAKNVVLFSATNSAPLAAPEGRDIRIIAGYSKKEYVDQLGQIWGPDRYYTGGAVFVEPQIFVARASDTTLFKTARQGEFSYHIPLKPGTYELRLFFVETDYGPWTLRGGGEVSRLFHMDVNGKRLITDFDVFSDAGGTNIADERILKDISPASDGYLHLSFTKAIDYPVLNALEILPSLPGKIQPVRIVAQEHSYTDEAGRLWSPDRYSFGGRLATATQMVVGTPDPGLYSEERYGHFDYAIPVADGQYALTLSFAETYFGPNNPGRGGVGSRLFDVYCNGAALLRSFDIFKEAGGENRALDKTFHGLQPNGVGKLMLLFVPVKNYATVKAIKVVDESR